MKRYLIAGACAVLAMTSCTSGDDMPTTVGNPYLPLWEHIPDGEPYVFEDPDQPGKYRVYINLILHLCKCN